MKIQDFAAILQKGGARSNRFEVAIEFPAAAGDANTIRRTAFTVRATSFPGSTVGTIEQPFRGRTLKIPGDRVYEPWTCTFVNDDVDMTVRTAFEKWQNAINSYNTNQGFSGLNDIFATVSVYQLDTRTEQRGKAYVMKMAWPSELGPVEVSQDANDEISTFDVTFQYSDHDNGVST